MLFFTRGFGKDRLNIFILEEKHFHFLHLITKESINITYDSKIVFDYVYMISV